MSFPRYPEYKDSGVAWLGSVPTHWQAKRTGYFFQERREKVSDKDFDALSVTKNGVVPQLETAAKTDDGDNRKKVCAGDFVINSRSDRKGSAGAADRDGSVSLISTVLRPRDEVEIKFAHHLLRSELFQEEFYRFGKGIVADLWSTNFTEMRNIVLAIPPLQEQRAIATFLDRETAKIDALVAEQEKLIALLQEKRQAVISHAVTKGLDPNVPMKDSGVEWLGEVPGHWEIKPLRYCVDFQEGPGILADDFRDDGVPLIRVAGVQSKWATLEGCNYLDPEKVAWRWQHFRVSEGDLLVSASASMGTLSEVGPEVEGAIPYTGIIRMRGRDGEMIKDFLRHVFVSSLFLTQIDLLKAGATIQHYGPTHLSQMFVIRPPVSEQVVIAEFIDQELERFDELSSEAERIVTLLQERRTALISAAVTGQIDVRGLAGDANAPDSIASSDYPASA